MRLVQQAAILNHEAAALVRSGRLVDATHALEHAIDLLCMSTNDSERDGIQRIQNPTLGLLSAENKQAAPIPEQVEYNHDGMMFIHDELFNVFDVAMDETTDMYRTACIFTVFNLALVWQLHARVTSSEASAVRAIALYQSILPTTMEWAIDALFQCLILNNLAELHRQLCQYDCTAHCMELVARIANETKCLDLLLCKREVKAIALNYALAQFATAAPTA
jgi:hypothetical protein